MTFFSFVPRLDRGSPEVGAVVTSCEVTELLWGSPIKSGNTGFVERGNS